ncbi:MAG: hypothetical protein IPM39_13735 [Chloroflexi bacterium]|nr:hypothetical protein [Chloroflexota bacterium]
MQNTHARSSSNPFGLSLDQQRLRLPRKAMIGVILIVALLAFEIFNFDTTRYALQNLLGEVQFIGLQWAAILAVAFCAIDFAGLVRLFTPEQGSAEPKEVWYLMGAWLLGATMNAVMTWWAVSLTLLNHDFGNEVLSRGQLLKYVPIFVAVLVWLTRILFIGAFTVAGEHIFDFGSAGQTAAKAAPSAQVPAPRPLRAGGQPVQAAPPRPRMATKPAQAAPRPTEVPTFLDEYEPVPAQPTRVNPAVNNGGGNSRVRQRPPAPNPGMRRVPMSGVQARSQNQR